MIVIIDKNIQKKILMLWGNMIWNYINITEGGKTTN